MTTSSTNTESTAKASQHHGSAYDLFIAVVSVVSICIITWQLLLPADSEMGRLLVIFDWGFCFIFLLDYIRNIVAAKHRLRYVFTWGLFDLASSIPVIPWFRYARFAGILRIIRIIRSVRILKQVYHRDHTAFAVSVTMLVGIAIIIGVTAAVLHVERTAEGASITTGPEATWWAVVTVSTVGYGDYAPVTDTGRTLAAVLMITGIGLFATFAGALANIFMRRVIGPDEQETTAMSMEARLLKLEVNHAEVLKLLRDQTSDND